MPFHPAYTGVRDLLGDTIMTRCTVGLLITLALVLLVALHAAAYMDQILNGAQPGDLPVGQPMTFELALNLKTAQASRTSTSGNICQGWILLGRGTKLAFPPPSSSRQTR